MNQADRDILTTLIAEQKALRHRLYGENWDKGDIPELKERLDNLNCFRVSFSRRLVRIETIVFLAITVGIPTNAVGLW